MKRKSSGGIITEKRFEGAPDLVVEIVSPSSAKIDRVDKFLEYEKAGVAEYWLIDPRPNQQQADFYILDKNGNYDVAAIDVNGRFHSTALPNFYLDLSCLRTDPLPNPELLLAEIIMQAENVAADIRSAYAALHTVLSQLNEPRVN